ncbi:hypothetical protein QFC21_006540 [Naganishia friedmannii]|uniref:Uncharacterized protein n=1 Tax=Naganishia friedmannii TaxID=89922 RepID=A0ACC2V1I3_9TREE|nr:hypothetical protein QFC21_006540 [Naganishia friedmannii]
MKVIITGASGVLGRATTRYFHSQGDTVIPLSFTRSGPANTSSASSSSSSLPAYQKLDLLDFAATRDFFHSQNNNDEHVDVIVHCAAERRPDVAEQDPVRAERLNKDVVEVIAGLAEEMGYLMIYVSTDYVFDGKSPPYKPADAPNPLNLYGKLKEAGEQAVLASRKSSKHAGQAGKRCIVLRVPLLYGEVEFNSETAVNIFVDVIEDQSGKTYKSTYREFPFFSTITCITSAYTCAVACCSFSGPLCCTIPYMRGRRRASNVRSRPCVSLFSHSPSAPATAHDPPPSPTDHSKALPPIVHFSSQKGLTKYEMTRLIASFLQQPIEQVIPDTTDPAMLPNQTVQRPGNTQLSVRELEDKVGISAKEQKGFEAWWREWAERYRAEKA